ncbi:MAG: hypothetical protein R3F31_14765 [Verrucomicrobiales bacterium]
MPVPLDLPRGCPVRTYSSLGTMAKDPYCEVYSRLAVAESEGRNLRADRRVPPFDAGRPGTPETRKSGAGRHRFIHSKEAVLIPLPPSPSRSGSLRR